MPVLPKRFARAALLLAVTTAATARAQDENAPVDQQARALIATALERYRAASSYHDRLTALYQFVGTSNDGQPIREESPFEVELTFATPNRLALSTEGLRLLSNGERLWVYLEPLQEYIAQPAPEKLDLADLDARLPRGLPPHPVLHALINRDQTFDQLYPMVGPFTRLAREELDGRPGTRIYGSFDVAPTPLPFDEGRAPLTLWFDDRTGLLGQLTVELTELSRQRLGLTGETAAPDAPLKALEREAAILTLADVKIGVDVPAAQFTFQPPADAKQVDAFSTPGLPDPRTLIGKPAPAFTTKDLAGETLDIEKLRGRVVLLDFWATWCAPCVAAMPHLQQLHEQFKDRPVSIIGVNQDNPRSADQVASFLKRHKVTFRQVPDPEAEIGRKYRVSGIPCSVLIGSDGVVQAVHVGFNPAAPDEYRKQLAGEIEKLLKGEPIAPAAP